MSPSPSPDYEDLDDPWLAAASTSRWSVGEVAKTLGIPVSTLRTWDQRHGVGPATRVEGRHRRYGERDVENVRRFAALVESGVSPTISGRSVVLARDIVDRHRAFFLACPGASYPLASAAIPAIVGAAVALDHETLTAVVGAALAHGDIERVWPGVLVPALRVIGNLWHHGVTGIEPEHVSSEVVSSALRAQIAAVGTVGTVGTPAAGALVETVVLVSVDLHHLPLLALQLALSERGIECIQLGPSFPAEAFSGVESRVDVDRFFVWASIRPERPDAILESVVALRRPSKFVLGGPGWDDDAVVALDPPARVVTVSSLDDALAALTT